MPPLGSAKENNQCKQITSLFSNAIPKQDKLYNARYQQHNLDLISHCLVASFVTTLLFSTRVKKSLSQIQKKCRETSLDSNIC